MPKLSEQEKAKRAREREKARKAKEREKARAKVKEAKERERAREKARREKERQRERSRAAREKERERERAKKERERERAKKERERERERAKSQRERERRRAAQKKAKERAQERAAAAEEAERATLKPGVSLATHHTMVANKSKNTKPELRVRAALREAGLSGYRIHWKAAAGSPDICYPGRKVAIFVNGCFWHACPHCTPRRPSKNPEFWTAKFARNQARDAAQHDALVADGWLVLVLWECRLKGDRFAISMREVVREVRSAQAAGEGRIVEVGTSPAWVKRARLKAIRSRHRS